MARIVFTEPAEYDLLDIEYYKHPLVEDELLKRMGLRRAYFDNYNIFYYYDVEEDVVYIIRVLYNKADWQNILKR